MSASFRVRSATIDDIPYLVAYRRAMFESMSFQHEHILAAMSAAMTEYLARAIPSGEYHGWVAEANGDVIASGGMVIHYLPPSPRNMDGREAYIMNIYTVPAWRAQGVATAIMQAILEYIDRLGIPVVTLHASAAGRPIYEKLGFEPTNEMRLLRNGNGHPKPAK
jgi:GNAT superfamily N-acetyltransferase